MDKRICFISIIGRPNAGKSTLLNNILNYNLAIVSSKAQTTRDQIIGVYTNENYQLIFTDTPGIHKKQSVFGETLNKKSFESINENDLILFLQPANEEIWRGDDFILEKIKDLEIPKIALITKIDLINDPKIIQEKKDYFLEKNMNDVICISNKNKKSIDGLIKELYKYTYESEFFYDPNDITDKSIAFLAKEKIRESAINNLRDEIPHAILIEIVGFDESDENKTKIEANIIVSKESQKAILIGKNGSMIKRIGSDARKKIELQLDKNVYLQTKVLVDKNWKNDPKKLKKYGY
ncbi:MAG: GTPase Era [Metamycoplasmataceae bacterium]